jgi:hypothetical protein
MFCGECGSAVNATPLTRPAIADPRPSDTTIIEPLPRPASAGPAIVSREIVLEPPAPAPEPVAAADSNTAVADEPSVVDEQTGPTTVFFLTFSTGEHARVMGGGLLGRRPIAQPGESVAQVVQITDPGRSVSKTHLEFGLEGGELWICDRYSGNGTVVHAPGGGARLCEPGRRYRVGRGARVEIGDQHFDVS